MISLLNCDRATMWVLTSDKSKLWSMVQPANARRGAALMRLEVPISPSSILGSAVLNGEPINLPDVYEDPRFDQKYDIQTGYRTRSMLSMPLIDMKTEDVVGCLQVLNKQDAMGQPVGQSFDDTDLHLAKSFASIVAVGIEQAKFNQASDSAVGMAIKAENKR